MTATVAELEAGLGEIVGSPSDDGIVELVVRRPAEGEREILDEAQLVVDEGLAGDSWIHRHAYDPGGAAQLTLMNTRAIALIAAGRDEWPLAGDQLFVDLDLSEENLPPGTRLALGSAVVEVSETPHTGCAK